MKYVDLHVAPPADNEKACERTAELLRISGYSLVGLTIPTGLMKDRTEFLKGIFNKAGIEVALRVNLSSSSRIELLRLLRRLRRNYDIIGVRCANSRVATVACRDSRVDVVYFDPSNRNVRFNHALANVLRGALEINLISSILKEPNAQTFSSFMRQCVIATEHSLRVVVSSGTVVPEMVRSPTQLAALACTLGLSPKQSLAGVSQIPSSIVDRNSKRLSPQFIEQGVRVILPTAG